MKAVLRLFTIILLVISYCTLSAGDIYNLIPRPKTAYEKQGVFSINSSTKIVVKDTLVQFSMKAASYLHKLLFEQGINSKIYDEVALPSTNVILIGNNSDWSQLDSKLSLLSNKGEFPLHSEGYIIDINPNEILISGADSAGIFNSVSTIYQLIDFGRREIKSAHIYDYPDYNVRWLFSQHNLRGNNAITGLRKILDTAAMYKLNGIAQGDFKYFVLEDQPDFYFDSVRTFSKLCYDRNVEITPFVANIGWSDGILVRDPNLAEGLPTSAEYIIEGDTGRLIPDNRISLPGGDFENLGSNGKFSGWSWFDEKYVSQDKSVHHSGNFSALCTNFDGANCRFVRSMSCRKYRGYVISAWIKTENFRSDEFKIMVLGDSLNGNYRALTFTQYSIPATTDWLKVQVVFNTLYFDKIHIYTGAWGASQGKFWLDDIQINDYGLTNILRRKGAPVHVSHKIKDIAYQEGKDYEYIADSKMLTQYGNFGPYHQPPAFRRKTRGSIVNGDTLIVSSYHPFTAVSDNNGNGSVMVCLSEDTLYSIISTQTEGVNKLYHSRRFFLSHDEIRNMNWDDACLNRNISPAKMLADNITKCTDIMKAINPNAQLFIWNDMVDSLHNAVNQYYLLNGDLRGDWDMIPKSLVICNWNGGKADESLKWFADKGFSQISSPYYDVQNASTIRRWRLAQNGIDNILGMMYTTWAGDYNFLKPFGYYAWGAGPAIYHKPLDSTDLEIETLTFKAYVTPDPYDNTDKIVSVRIVLSYLKNNLTITDTLILDQSGDNYSKTVTKPARDFYYKIIAENSQKLIRETPLYIINNSGPNNVGEDNQPDYLLNITPNPLNTTSKIQLYQNKADNISLKIYDVLGNEVMNIFDGYSEAGFHEFSPGNILSVAASNIYFLKLTGKSGVKVVRFVIIN